MAHGLQCFDEHGKCTYDSGTYTTTYLGSFTATYVYEGTNQGSFEETRVNGDNFWWAIISRTATFSPPTDPAEQFFGYSIPVLDCDYANGVISWKTMGLSITSADTLTVVYGTYI